MGISVHVILEALSIFMVCCSKERACIISGGCLEMPVIWLESRNAWLRPDWFFKCGLIWGPFSLVCVGWRYTHLSAFELIHNSILEHAGALSWKVLLAPWATYRRTLPHATRYFHGLIGARYEKITATFGFWTCAGSSTVLGGLTPIPACFYCYFILKRSIMRLLTNTNQHQPKSASRNPAKLL